MQKKEKNDFLFMLSSQITNARIENERNVIVVRDDDDEDAINTNTLYLGLLPEDQLKVLRRIPNEQLSHILNDGDLMHVPLFDFEKRELLKILPQMSLKTIKECCLPGRDPEQIIFYCRKHYCDSTRNFIGNEDDENVLIYRNPITTFHNKKAPSLFIERKKEQFAIDFLLKNRREAIICQSSGPISQMAITNNNSRLIVGSVANKDPDYNRPGELLWIDLNNKHIFKLRAHQYHSNGLCASVSDVIYSEKNSCFISSGYDGKVRTWSLADGSPTHANALFESKDEIIKMSINSSETLLLSAVKDGTIALSSLNSDSIEASNAKSVPNVLIKSIVNSGNRKSSEYSNASGLNSIMDAKFLKKENSSIFGVVVGWSSSAKGGILEFYNAESYSRISNIEVKDVGCVWMAGSNDGCLVVLGGGSITETRKGDGFLRLIDARNSNFKVISKLQTGHKDVDIIEFSPCDGLVLSCEASDNSICVYDLRWQDKPLHVFSAASSSSASNEVQLDSIVSLNWSSNGRLLISGGGDGIVKVWDLGLANPLVSEVEGFDGGINSITSSATNDDVLAIGTENGSVYLHNIYNGKMDSVYKIETVYEDEEL